MSNKMTLIKQMEQYYSYDENENKSTCLLPNCTSKFVGFLPSNLKRHLRMRHTNDVDVDQFSKKMREAMDESSNDSTISNDVSAGNTKRVSKTELEARDFLKGCVKLITEHDVSYRTFDGEGFPLMSKTFEKTLGYKIDSVKMEMLVGEAAASIKKLCTKELHSKLINLKIDVTTKYRQSVLGINVQYIDKGLIHVRTLGMIQLTDQNLSEEILNILKRFDLRPQQIYTITTDNGASMVKMVELVDHDQEDVQSLEYFEDFLSTDKEDDEKVIENISKLSSFLPLTTVECARCLANVLQLAVDDVLKTLTEELSNVREIVKEMRKVDHQKLYSIRNTKPPIMDIETRWMSSYLMMENLYQNFQFYRDLNDNTKVPFKIETTTFDFIEDFVIGFKPVFETTKKFQKEQLVVGDFILAWEECKMKLSETGINSYSERLLKEMEERQDDLLANDSVLAGIYLDPRLTNAEGEYLSDEHTKCAQDHLFKVWTMLDNKVKTQNIKKESMQQSTSSNAKNPDERLIHFINRHRSFTKQPEQLLSDEMSQHNEIVKAKIKRWPTKILQRPPFTTDILKFYTLKQFEDPEIYRISQVVLAIPMTQLTVEKAFNALALTLTWQNTRFLSKNLEDLMITKFNSDLLNDINFCK